MQYTCTGKEIYKSEGDRRRLWITPHNEELRKAFCPSNIVGEMRDFYRN